LYLLQHVAQTLHYAVSLIVDIETLKTTQSDIIETIEQTLQIQQNGRQKRKESSSKVSVVLIHLLSQQVLSQLLYVFDDHFVGFEVFGYNQ
jgi:uncharacterized protein YaaN involved in tellurite resistance